MICKTCTNYQNCCKEKLLTVHTWIVIFIELMLSLAYRLSAPDSPVGITYKVHVVCIQVGSHSVFMEVMYLFLCCLSVCQSKFRECSWLCYLSIFLLKEKNKKYSNDFSTGILLRKERDNWLFQTIYKRLWTKTILRRV